MSGDPPITILPAASQRLLDAARHVLATPGLPPVVLIGGLAVTMRVGAAGIAHPATLDIDLVTVYAEPEPEALEILAAAHHSEQHPLLVDNVKVDLIPTSPIVDGDLDGFSDKDILFLAGHRWAFEGAEPVRLSTAGSPPRAHAHTIVAFDHAITVASLDDIITSKEYANRRKDARYRPHCSRATALDESGFFPSNSPETATAENRMNASRL